MVRIKHAESKRLRAGDASQIRQGKSEVNINSDGIHCSCGRCKRKGLARMFFPQELVFNILLRLPAQVIYDVMMHVCREWMVMISTRDFISHHLMHSTTGLLILGYFSLISGIFISMGPGGVQTSRFSYRLPAGAVRSSCNGLVLVSHRKSFYVANPITNKQMTRPFFKETLYLNNSCLAYAAASMEYKVVQTYDHDDTMNFRCAILTIGVNQVWRHIDTSHLSLRTRRSLGRTSFVAGGFVHWIGKNFVLTLNVETETIHQFRIPPRGGGRLFYFLETGSNISSVASCKELLWDVWEMKPETGEWTKLFDVDFEARRCMLERLFGAHKCSLEPVGWLKFREVLLFRGRYPSSLWIAYDVKTQEIHSFDLGTDEACSTYLVHVNSLVWLEGC